MEISHFFSFDNSKILIELNRIEVKCGDFFFDLPVTTSLPAVALRRVSPVSRCLVRQRYDLYPSSGATSRMCSSPEGSTMYLPSNSGGKFEINSFAFD